MKPNKIPRTRNNHNSLSPQETLSFVLSFTSSSLAPEASISLPLIYQMRRIDGVDPAREGIGRQIECHAGVVDVLVDERVAVALPRRPPPYPPRIPSPLSPLP